MMESRFAIAALVSLLCVACSDTTDVQSTRQGRYVMKTISAKSPPQIVQENAAARLTFHGGALRLNKDMTFTDSTDLTITPMYNGAPLPGGNVSRHWDVAWGLYRMSGDTVYFDSLRDEHYFMVFQVAGGLVQDLKGTILFYQK